MRGSVWSVLGIEPTADPLAIRRAYAARLKQTRPDEDAQAYQALREAYDLTLRWARASTVVADPLAWVDESPASDVLSQAHEPVGQAPAQAHPLPKDTAAEVAPALDLDALQHSLITDLDALWSTDGAKAVLAGWEGIRTQFDQWPLSERPSVSLAMADWLLARPPLSVPPALAFAFEAYFGWLADFRVDRTLGLGRAEHLRRRFEGLVRQHRFAGAQPLVPVLPDPDESEADTEVIDAQRSLQLQPVLRLHALLLAHRRLLALLWMVLGGARARWVFVSAGVYGLSKLGVGAAERVRLGRWFGMAIAVRVALVLVAFQLVVQALPGHVHLAWPALGYVIAISAVLHAATGVSDYLLGGRWRSQAAVRTTNTSASGWSRCRPWLGVALLVAAGAMAANWPSAAEDAAFAGFVAVWAVVFLNGAACLWPHDTLAGRLAAGLVMGGVVLLNTGMPNWGLPSVWVWVSLWVLLGVHLNAWHRLEVNGVLAVLHLVWLPVWGSLALLSRHGLTLALTPLALSGALWAADLLTPAAWHLLVTWLAWSLALALVQTLAFRWVRRRLAFHEETAHVP